MAQFFFTQKCVNRDKTDFAMKHSKSRVWNYTQYKEWNVCTQKSKYHPWKMWRNFRFLSCGDIWNNFSCVEISDFSTSVMHKNLKFLHMKFFLRFFHRWRKHCYYWQVHVDWIGWADYGGLASSLNFIEFLFYLSRIVISWMYFSLFY